MIKIRTFHDLYRQTKSDRRYMLFSQKIFQTSMSYKKENGSDNLKSILIMRLIIDN